MNKRQDFEYREVITKKPRQFELNELQELIVSENYLAVAPEIDTMLPIVIGTYLASEGISCSICKRHHNHKKGRVFELQDGRIFFSGDYCARLHFGQELQKSLNEYDRAENYERLKRSLLKSREWAETVDLSIIEESSKLMPRCDRFFTMIKYIFEQRRPNGSKLDSFLNEDGNLIKSEFQHRDDILSKEIYFRYGVVFSQSVPNLNLVEPQLQKILELDIDQIPQDSKGVRCLRTAIRKAGQAKSSIDDYLSYRRSLRNFLNPTNWEMFVEWFEVVTQSSFSGKSDLDYEEKQHFIPLRELKDIIYSLVNKN